MYAFQVITLADGTQAQVSGFEPGQPGVHTLAEVATATAAANEQRQVQVIQQQQEEQQQSATAIEINGEIAGTGDGNIIIAGEDGQGNEGFRVLQSDLGWVDLDFGCSAVFRFCRG